MLREVSSGVVSTDSRALVAYKLVGTSEPAAQSWSRSIVGNPWGAIMLGFSGVARTGTIYVEAAPNTESGSIFSGTDAAAPSLTGAVGDLLVCFWFARTTSTTFTYPGDMTPVVSNFKLAADVNYIAAVATKAIVSAGATGTKTVTFGATAESTWSYSILLKPLAASASDTWGIPL